MALETELVPEFLDKLPLEVAVRLYHGGEELPPGECVPLDCFNEKPRLEIIGGYTEAYYSLWMADLDAPSEKNPAFREWRLWTLINAKAGNFNETNAELVELSKYQPPSAAIEPDTGTHRIVFLVLRQTEGKLDITPFDDRGNKRAWCKIRDLLNTLQAIPCGGTWVKTRFGSKAPAAQSYASYVLQLEEPTGLGENISPAAGAPTI